MPMFIAALFISQDIEQLNVPSTESMDKAWHIYTAEYYSIQKETFVTFAEMWEDREINK